MRRREFITLLCSLSAALPHVASAQQFKQKKRIAFLTGFSQKDSNTRVFVAAFLRELRTQGWTEGHNIQVAYGYGGGDDARLLETAKALIAASPDVVLVHTNPAASALHAIDDTIPTVFVQVGDPVGSGFVKSLSHPGGNLTGFSATDPEMGSKWVELLKQITPTTNRILAVRDAAIRAHAVFLRTAEAAASKYKITLTEAEFHDISDIDRTLAAFARDPGGALMVFPSPFVAANRSLIGRLAASHGLPSIYPFHYPESGFLLSYGPDPLDQFRNAATYVDRILRGAKPSDLPVQEPVRYEFTINLKTAQALGITIPPGVLAIVDDVIE